MECDQSTTLSADPFIQAMNEYPVNIDKLCAARAWYSWSFVRQFVKGTTTEQQKGTKKSRVKGSNASQTK